MYLMKSITSVTAMPFRLAKVNHFVKSQFLLSVGLFILFSRYPQHPQPDESNWICQPHLHLHTPKQAPLSLGPQQRNVFIKATVFPWCLKR